MTRTIVSLLTSAFLGLLLHGPAAAQYGAQSGSVIALHAQAHNVKGVACGDLDPNLACSGFTSTWPVGTGADVYLVVARARADLGISAVSLGIAYDAAAGSGVDVFGTTACGDLEYPNDGPNGPWPASHGGNRILWVRTTNCQQSVRGADGVHAVAYGFYVYAYSPDTFSIIENENLMFGPELLVSDCPGPANSSLPYPSHAGRIGFGDSGYNPCAELSGDITPPVLQSATGLAGTETVTATFSEAMGAGAEVASNYGVYPSADPSSPLAVTSATPSGSQVVLGLGSSLASATAYTVAVSNVEDEAGNTIWPNSTVGFTTGEADVTPPTLWSVWGAAYTDRVNVRFNEPVTGGAETVSNYGVYPASSPAQAIPVVSASLSDRTVLLRLAETLQPGTYTVAVSNVSDPSGNVIAPNSTRDFVASTGSQSQAVVMLHAQAHDTKGLSCSDMSSTLSCDEFTQTWPVHSAADVFLVVAWGNASTGISGLSCGIAYDPAPGQGCDVLGFQVCADLDYPNSGPYGEWPASHGGNTLVWTRNNNCQNTARANCGVHAVACGFYVYAYSPDQFAVIQNENVVDGPLFAIVDCELAGSDLPYPSHAGKVGFGMGGYNPCVEEAPVPTVQTTWGKLKNQYR
jgi:hypothetical protein